MRILVTGGAGFIGSHIVDAALAAGHDVAVFDDLSSGKRENLPEGVPLTVGDLRDAEAIRKCVGAFKPDAVSHQAAQASVSVSMRDPRLDVEVNVIGSINLFDACVASGVGRVVFASTGGAIYGEVPEGQVADESWVPKPISPYAISKLAVEQLMAVYKAQHALPTTVLRYANVYGPRQDPHGEAGVVAIFAKRLLRSAPLQINARRTTGDAGCVRDYVYVSDVAKANLAALTGLQQPVVNVGTSVAGDTESIATGLANALDIRPTLTRGPMRAGDLERSVLDNSIFTQLFGEPVALTEGLAKTAQWYRRTGEES